MAGLFRMEDVSGVDFEEGQLITEGDEGESVAAAIAEVTEEEAGIADDEREMDQLQDDEGTASEVEQVLAEEAPKTEHSGLTQTNARLAKVVLKRILGKTYIDRKFPKMEHFNSRADARESTKFVQEGITEALKSFWETLKAQFKKIWAKMKSWYIKTFSAAKSLNAKAVAIRTRAETSSSTIDKKTFKFSQTKLLSMEGRLKDYPKFKEGVARTAKIVELTHEVPTDNMIDQIEDMIDAEVKKSTASESQDNNSGIVVNGKARSATGDEKSKRIVDAYLTPLGSVLGENPASLADPSDKKLLESLGGGETGDAEVNVSGLLPGDRLLAKVKLKDGYSGDDAELKRLRMARLKFINSKYKPKEVSADAEVTTLNSSQVAELCNIIVDASANIYEYDKNWQKVDRKQETFLRKLDELLRDAEDLVKDDDDHKGKDLSAVRTAFSTATNFVKSLASVPSMVSSYAMPMFAATLNYCEGSMRNYK